MYKTKIGPIVSRPARIGNTFIGSKTDLSQYGYYTVDTPKPNDAPEGQQYYDAGGTYDEQAFTYTPDWQLEDAPVPQAPDYGTKITKLAMRNRFTFAEKVAIQTASESSADLQVYLDDLAVSTYIDLSRSDTIAGVQMLESSGVIATGRASEILTAPVTEEEVPQ